MAISQKSQVRISMTTVLTFYPLAKILFHSLIEKREDVILFHLVQLSHQCAFPTHKHGTTAHALCSVAFSS